MWINNDGCEFEAVVCLILGLSVVMVSIILGRWRNEDGRFPPGPFAWPIIGHLHLLHNLPHQALRDVSRKYGHIVGLRLGLQPAVVVCSPALAKEVLLTHDKLFANRPPYEFTSILLYGPHCNDIIFSPHGPQWKKHRKACSVSLFTAKRLLALQHLRQDEMTTLLHSIQDQSAGGVRPVDIGRCVGMMSSNLIMRLLQSRAAVHVGGEDLLELVKELEHVVSFPTIGDLIPWLSCLDFSKKRYMRRLHTRIDKVLNAILMERKQSTSHHDDLLQALLSKEVGQNDMSSPPEETLTVEEIKCIMLDMLAAGIHTTALTLEWAVAELLRNPHCLQRLQEEIDTVLGKAKKQISDADTPKLSYLKCVVKEVFRLHPVIPLLVPRMSSEECKLEGYTIPAKTYMFVNVWAMGRDEEVWPNATQFVPERFEGKEMDLKGQNYELLPFGSGRRICLGLPLALSIVDVTLANLVNSFDWALPHGETNTSINMDEKNGITINKVMPTIAIPKLRAFT